MYLLRNVYYPYPEVLEVREEYKPPLAKRTNMKEACINMRFDDMDDATEFTSAVFQPPERRKEFVIRPTFMNPRTEDKIPKEHARFCFIM